MKFLKAYKLFEYFRDGLSKEQIEFLNGSTRGDWKYNQNTGLVDVIGRFDCSSKGLKDFLGTRFGKVSGNFNCSNNQLTSLEGSPSRVGGIFYCGYNQLTTLEGSPSRVDGNFNCSNNQLTSLEGSPSRVGGIFYCGHNQLTTLEGSPSRVDGDFNCSYNQLTTLEGSPSRVGGTFYCGGIGLKDFLGIRFGKVSGNFYCHNNQLTTLEGSPGEVGGGFDCSRNPLKSLKGAPEIIRGNLYLYNSLLNYNLKSFLDEISKNGPELTELLLTHHFITPDVLIKQINKDRHFLIPISKLWNNPIFSEKQEALTKKLPQKELEIIDALWSVGPYL
jgi:hypothetical protein